MLTALQIAKAFPGARPVDFELPKNVLLKRFYSHIPFDRESGEVVMLTVDGQAFSAKANAKTTLSARMSKARSGGSVTDSQYSSRVDEALLRARSVMSDVAENLSNGGRVSARIILGLGATPG